MRALRHGKFSASKIALASLLSFFLQKSQAATVTPETVAFWNQHVQQAKAGIAQEICSPEGFLSIDVKQKRSAETGYEKNLAARPAQGRMVPVPSGLIHHWTGTVFVRNARSADVLAVLENYDSYASVFRPAVVDSRLLSRTEDDFTYRLKFEQRGFGVKAGLLGVFRSSYYQLGPDAGYSITEATELNELENPGTPDERLIPFSTSHGYVEKIFTIVRYREADTGVYVRVETMTLSRNVPTPVRWLISPVIERFSRETMAGTLESLRNKVQTIRELESASEERPRSHERRGW